MKLVLSVLSYVIAGFFIYAAQLIAFINEGTYSGKLYIMGIFLLPALIGIAIGLKTSGYKKWERNLGLVFILSSSFTLMVIMMFIFMLQSPEFLEAFERNNPGNSLSNFSFYSDYWTGAATLLFPILLGSLLLWKNHRKETIVEINEAISTIVEE